MVVVIGFLAVGFSNAFGEEIDESDSEGRFIQTAIMGTDDRCPLSYGSQATPIEKAFYGVGALYAPRTYTSTATENQHSNKGTGHLVGRRDLVVTAAHIFRNPVTRVYGDWRKYKFYVRVWVPEENRKSPDRPYEFRPFGIKRICFGSKSGVEGDFRDFALLQLDERVSEVVDGIPVDPQHWIEPLAFDGRGRESFPNFAMTVGFHRGKKWRAQKNCKPFSLFDQTSEVSPSFLSSERRRGLLMTDGDFVERSSGSSIALLDERGRPHLAAILAGEFVNAPKVNFNGRDQFNYAVDAKEFYNEFVSFRSSLDVSGDEICKGSRVIPLRSRM
ncbi:MAG: hypothetical protein IPJ71_07200 [Bdellovibrionales bacterium]|nr:hypothetical protein [Bdellovibrionales bacterium]